MVNATVDSLSIPTICEICQTKYGFSSADLRSIIVMVVFIGIALISCYIGVLWYSIRTRYISDDKLPIIVENVHTNEAFNHNDEQDEDIEKNISTMADSTTIQPVELTIENEKEQL